VSRLPEPFGSRIDRNRPLRFSFEGRAFEGFEGDCIASALGASGQWLLSRSFKYHRPRGVVSMAGAEANTLVQLASEPNVAADLAPLCDGMKVTAQNVNGSLQSDRDALIGRFAKLLPVGFYYRTFTGPTRNAWLKVWEPMIRRKAGLGVIDAKAPHRHFDMAHLHCDLLVVGAGPAGLSAAIAAAGAGADVVLCDENPEIGGSLTYRRCEPDVLTRLASAAAALPSLRILPGTVCNGWYEDNWLPLIQGDRLYRTRAPQVVVATGAIEQPALFRNNDLPGIMTGGVPIGQTRLPPAPSRRLLTLRTSQPLSSQGGPVGVEAMKNRLHAILTEERKTNIIMSMYKKGARYKDIASETGLSIPSVRYRVIELSHKGLVDFEPRYRSHTKRRR
jgi:sarcosine oxidase, subunit alpha